MFQMTRMKFETSLRELLEKPIPEKSPWIDEIMTLEILLIALSLGSVLAVAVGITIKVMR